ncbi:MAG TPA: hypothetical protein PLY87_14375 [Planctomycetaceae bacterium]|nr:hypothetical protein [Planctomycetaceae bacterium]HQZ66270.1 hypothetical protein [Planctomycetaceae bacterium]
MSDKTHVFCHSWNDGLGGWGWVAGVGLSGAKETPAFRAIALQPRPPINS